jgi:hypothetical protein
METSPKQSFPPNIYDQVEFAYENGSSDIEVCKILKIRMRDFEQRYQTNQAFREVIDTGRMMRRAYWMQQGRENLFNPKFNRNLWLDFMKNEFGWADKSEVVTTEREKTMEELKLELGPMLKRLAELQVASNKEDTVDGEST